jgi:Domain of unknown function (DUF6306)
MIDGMPDEADSGSTEGYSSPPCLLHELDPSYLGYLAADELLALLNELIEAERAGAKVVGRLGETAADPAVATTLRAVAKDESRFCAMLRRHVTRLGGTPSRKTGLFHDKVLALDGIGPRLALLNRGQGWVVRKLREALPRIHDDALRRDLQEMLTVHQRNIRDCDALPIPG